jgi:hypothetical protein
MAHLFLPPIGIIFSYITLCVYLFGDLTIYSATVPKSLMNLVWSVHPFSSLDASPLCSDLDNASLSLGSLGVACHPTWPQWMTRGVVYRVFVIAFVAMIAPLVLAGVTRTKYLQFATSFCRWSGESRPSQSPQFQPFCS